jgi:hypothetical protein
MSRLNRIAMPLMAVAMMSSVPVAAPAQNSLTRNYLDYTVSVQDMRSTAGGPEKVGYRDGLDAAQLDTLARHGLLQEVSPVCSPAGETRSARSVSPVIPGGI